MGDQDRNIVARKAGVMSVEQVGGENHDDMSILVEEPTVLQTLICVLYRITEVFARS